VKNLLASSLAVFLLSGCAGYHLGSVQPHYLRDVHSLAVPTFKNGTLVPRIEVLVTETVIKQLQADGTYRIAGGDEGADATLKGEVVRVVRSPARSVRGNVLATVEFNLTALVRFTVIGRDGVQLTSGEVAGATSFFVSTDVTTDERQALPLAAEQAAKQLVSQVAEGW
jgi:hypothetical protein